MSQTQNPLANHRHYGANSLVWFCPTCGQSIESAGTDESSRGAVRAFKARHRHKEKK